MLLFYNSEKIPEMPFNNLIQPLLLNGFLDKIKIFM